MTYSAGPAASLKWPPSDIRHCEWVPACAGMKRSGGDAGSTDEKALNSNKRLIHEEVRRIRRDFCAHRQRPMIFKMMITNSLQRILIWMLYIPGTAGLLALFGSTYLVPDKNQKPAMPSQARLCPGTAGPAQPGLWHCLGRSILLRPTTRNKQCCVQTQLCRKKFLGKGAENPVLPKRARHSRVLQDGSFHVLCFNRPPGANRDMNFVSFQSAVRGGGAVCAGTCGITWRLGRTGPETCPPKVGAAKAPQSFAMAHKTKAGGNRRSRPTKPRVYVVVFSMQTSMCRNLLPRIYAHQYPAPVYAAQTRQRNPQASFTNPIGSGAVRGAAAVRGAPARVSLSSNRNGPAATLRRFLYLSLIGNSGDVLQDTGAPRAGWPGPEPLGSGTCWR